MVIRETSDDAPAPSPAPPSGGSAEAFGAQTQPYRHELLVHCYRMLGSIDDAEDAVQETLTRAWHGRDTFRRAISFRAWLYRIATNVCLDAIDRRKRAHGSEEPLGVGPYPDDVLGESTAGPEALYDARESISLAFLTVLQLLPPRQRAVLILRDVLSWRAAEVAELLELTVPAVNSALHRARTTVASRYAPVGGRAARPQQPTAAEPGKLRSLLERYVHAWETADVAGLVALLRDDAVVSMPPGVIIAGRQQVGTFLAESVFARGVRIRLLEVRANGGPGFIVYSGTGSDDTLRAYAVVLIDVDGSSIARMHVFADQQVVAGFGVPAVFAS
jgi:RNA polymerase sigma-70 factor, ECF subfamily